MAKNSALLLMNQLWHLLTEYVLLLVQVPYNIKDTEIPENWACKNNVWDRTFASCAIPQALSNEEIDEVLACQVLSWYLNVWF